MFTTVERWLRPHLPRRVGDEAGNTEVVGVIVDTAHPSGNSENFEFVGAITDIAQPRCAEAVIRTREEELRDVIETIPAIVWSALPDGSNSYVNSRFADYCGMRAEQIAGTGWHVVTHPDDLERHNAKWLACAASGEPLEDELRFRRADGQYRWHLQRGVPLRDGAGRIVKWYCVLTDIEDRKRGEDKIREQETALRQMLDFTPQLIAVYGSNFQRLYANAVALDYLGLSLKEWRENSERSAFVHPDDRTREHDQAGKESPYALELRLRKADRSHHWFLAQYKPVRDADRQLIPWPVACTDIDDRKRAAEPLRTYNAALRNEVAPASVFSPIVW